RGEHRVVVAREVDRDGRALVDQPPARRGAERGEAGIDHEEEATAAQPPGVAPQGLALAYDRDRPGRDLADPHQGVDGCGPAHAVGLDAALALELLQRGLGLRTEDAVLA